MLAPLAAALAPLASPGFFFMSLMRELFIFEDEASTMTLLFR
jgi:hypothetical protein